ncbi:MAG: ABC transporter substrate-binding protein [Hahellaceae bacterium]|nr:ABC transporter substrate-binding protein [Hahellaceae bacterium]MCP5212874.1 ABC transporter substrate-binding protein [Hahellaceae bacterium]
MSSISLINNTLLKTLSITIALFSASGFANAAGTNNSATTATGAMHGIAMHGTPQYSANFTHLAYSNPEAPKKGTLKLGVVGDSFDSFNPHLVKGVPAAGMSYQYDTLMKKAEDEAFSLYGLIAESIEVPADRSWVEFKINPKAVFHDGHPITAEDVKFTFETLTTSDKVNPLYQAYYADVSRVEVSAPLTIRFMFSTNTNKELPLILAELPVFPKHYYDNHAFSKADLTAPLGSGPYKIASFDAGRSVTWERVKNYWAADLPVNKGFYNFDKIVYEYYKDNTIALEAFKAGEFDFRTESTARNWANAYVGPKFEKGELVKEEVTHEMPAGMQAFIMNTRKDVFADRKVRQALAYAFDFEWTNANLFYSQYKRTSSYFENSELASQGTPKGEELAILTPFKDKLPAEVFTTEYAPPSTTAPASIRKNLRTAVQLLKEAGWEVKNKVLTNSKTNQPMTFEILLVLKDFERVIQPFAKNLEILGIKADVRLIDTTQYINRVQNHDFDMIVYTIGQSNSPGNEQRHFWQSEIADKPGSRNLMGVRDPVVDNLIEQVISSPDREALINRTRALDRVLLWGHYVIPNWHNPNLRVAYKNTLAKPAVNPKTGVELDAWWFK